MRKVFIVFMLVLFSCMVLFSQIARATDYYVNGGIGNDNNDGLGPGAGNAWATLGKAASTVPDVANHTINVAAGTYTENVTDARNGTSPGYRHWLASGTVTINGTGDRGFFIQGDYVKLDGFTITGCTYSGVRVWYTSDYCVVTNCTIYHTGKSIEVAGTNHLIEDNDFSDPDSDSYKGDFTNIWGDSHTFRGNYYHNYLGDGTAHADVWQTHGESGENYPPATNILIEREHVFFGPDSEDTANADAGMLAHELEGTRAGFQLFNGNMGGWESYGPYTVRNCIFEAQGGFNFGTVVEGVYFYNNLFRGDYRNYNSYTGLGLSIVSTSDDIVIKNNVFINCAHGIKIGNDVTNVDCQNNFFWRHDSGTTTNTNNDPGTGDITNEDPLFTSYDIDTFNLTTAYQLQTDSPARDAGFDLTGTVTEDYAEAVRPQGTDYDIGPYEYTATPPTAALTGTLGDGATEQQIIDGGQVLTVTLTYDTFVATFGDDNQITTDFILGLDSGGSGVAGWDAEVKGDGTNHLTHAHVVRTNATTATVTLPAFGSFAITQNETITSTIPASSLTESSSPVVATPTFEITATPDPACALSGTLADNATEAQIVAGGQTLIFTFTNTELVATWGDDNQITTDFIQGLDSAQSETEGWNAEVRDKLTHAAVTRDSATQGTVLLPAAGSFDISANESITSTVPANSHTGSGTITATPTFAIIFFDTSTEEIVGMTLQ